MINLGNLQPSRVFGNIEIAEMRARLPELR
jgi:hypothetical protein